MPAYYNEIEPYAVQWLNNLIDEGLIAGGDVDSRSIRDVRPDDLKGYTQCHFFAGIGVWSYALGLAGWPDDQPVWTGSCPCQPFSNAREHTGVNDNRHLWPEFFRLISERRPPVIFGEQVSSKDGLAWLDLVSNNLEASRYAVGALDTSAAGVGAPHIRQRLYWAADTQYKRVSFSADCDVYDRCAICGSDYIDCGCPGPTQDDEYEYAEINDFMCGMAYTVRDRLPWRLLGRQDPPRETIDRQARSSRSDSYWENPEWEWVYCRDGRLRPVEPGVEPLAHGVASRMGKLRAYGNAIVAPQAVEFIRSYMEI